MGRLSTLALLVPLALACGAHEKVPPQPVPFSHRIHAGVNKIGCQMCHVYAAHSPVAGIPSMARCYGCHKFIDRDKPAVQLVVRTYQDGKVLEWWRVYRLPDHVFFTHEKHIAAGLRCQQCHGEVETMDVVRRASPLTMGWCVDCHRLRKAPTDCWTCHK
jgi:Cytochrome c7 and related cytochrome c